MKSPFLNIAIVLLFCGTLHAQNGKICGRLTDADHEDLGIPGAAVRLLDTQRGENSGMSGEFYILGIPVGSYTLRISAIGYHTMTCPIVVKEDSTAFVEFSMKQMRMLQRYGSHSRPEKPPRNYGKPKREISYISQLGELHSTVTDRAGKPLPNAEVLLTTVNKTEIAERTTDSTGICTLSSLFPGRYRAMVSCEGYKRAVRKIEISCDSVSELNVRLKRSK